MKMTSFFKMSVLAAGMVAAMGAQAREDAAILTVNGTIITSACSIDTESLATPINLGTSIDSTTLTTVGAMSTPTDFTISLSGCPANVANVAFMATGEQAVGNSDLVKVTSGEGDPGFGVAIYDDAGTLVPRLSSSKGYAINAETGAAQIALKAGVMSTNTAISSGEFSATTSFGITYP